MNTDPVLMRTPCPAQHKPYNGDSWDIDSFISWKTVGGVIRTMRVPFWQPPARPPDIFTILITGFFRWKTRLKIV
uniref:Uncharacterized protein n=1 Tax=Magallana gigas TaxID=29159 RepID=K1PRI8_MAGGI